MKKIFLFIVAAAFATSASAEGYQVNTLSAKQLGMGHVGVSQKLNSESVWFNPGAASQQEDRFSVSAGMTGIQATATATTLNNYVDPTITEESDNSLSTPMYFNANYKINDRLSVGLLFNTPFGSSMNWGDNWSGAHLVQNISLTAYNAQPTVSYKINDKLSVGAGLMMTWGTFELSRSMFPVGDATNAMVGAGAVGNNPLVSATLSGDAGMKFGVNVGALYTFNEKWSVGASYRSEISMAVDAGHAELDYFNDTIESALSSNFAGMDTGSFTASLPLPSTLSAGVTYYPNDRWELSAEFQWVHWSSYDSLVVTFNEAGLEGYNQNAPKNYSNTMISRVGAQFEATEWLTARAGFYVDESPVASDYLNPETPSMTKVGYTCGVSVMPFGNRKFSLDLAYGYITSADPERTGSYPYINSLQKSAAQQYAAAAKQYAAAAEQYAAAGKLTEAAQAKAGAEAAAGMAATAASKVLDPYQRNYTAKAHTFSIGASFAF